MNTNCTISRHSRPSLDTMLLRERPREERVSLHLPPPSPVYRKPEPEKKPEGGTCIIIQVWPTTPDSTGERSDRTH